MKTGFLLPIIAIVILSGIGFVIFNNFSKSPTALTQQTAASIIQYPESKNWQLISRRNLCFFATDDCSQPIDITFNTTDEWKDVYYFYRALMPQDGWNTNSMIWTSIPTNPVYTENTNGCTAAMLEKEAHLFYITVIC